MAATAGTVLVALLAGGCAAMPDSGGISRVELSQGSADKNLLQARVYPLGPAKGAKPRDLLTGFLDAVTADEGYDVARQYLTESAAAGWNPDAGIQVADNLDAPLTQAVTDTESVASLSVHGTEIATVDAKHSFRLSDGHKSLTSDFTFVRGKDNEWRIDKLAPGVIMNETNFRNSYRQVDRYFYAAPDPSAFVAGGAKEVLIADPIYLRRRTDPLTAAAKALVVGPSDWLAPVARTEFPREVGGVKVSVDDSHLAHVQLDVDAGDETSCRRMATQLFYTLADQVKGQVERVELKGRRGACTTGRADAGTPAGVSKYYQRADNGVLMVTDDQHSGDPVPGPLGKAQPGGTPLSTVAVARDGSRAAALSGDAHQLFSVPLAAGATAMPEPVLTSAAKAGDKDNALASPSWDGRGDLWVVDRAQSGRVVMVRGNKTYTVPVEGLDGQSVQALKISADGARVALVVRNTGTGTRSLLFGLVMHSGTTEAPTARIVGLRRVAPLLTDVASVSWAEADQLLVLGKEGDRIQQLYYISTDGSQSSDTPLQSGPGWLAISASESRGSVLAAAQPVLAVTEGKVYRLVSNQWREVQMPDKVSSYFYAG
ncbi:LpqB family beta-propeller domain-containing protein [Streptomyces sp. NRRL WC-3742]|uniref:LpqB family beta-propeller domain-containing protein n=1 Tax=Streptomyces sp. NRRL WC-3742 TaxID=1463934 RepID=UPI0004C93AF0|nr:LpqB family beta-propeller domain-containing protein [Streptomyces sp. NRRL WC-3742]